MLPEHWNDWPQSLKLSVPGNHDSPETFVHLTSWIHETPWFRRHDDLAFLGIDTSDLEKPVWNTRVSNSDAFWDEDIKVSRDLFYAYINGRQTMKLMERDNCWLSLLISANLWLLAAPISAWTTWALLGSMACSSLGVSCMCRGIPLVELDSMVCCEAVVVWGTVLCPSDPIRWPTT